MNSCSEISLLIRVITVNTILDNSGGLLESFRNWDFYSIIDFTTLIPHVIKSLSGSIVRPDGTLNSKDDAGSDKSSSSSPKGWNNKSYWSCSSISCCHHDDIVSCCENSTIQESNYLWDFWESSSGNGNVVFLSSLSLFTRTQSSDICGFKILYMESGINKGQKIDENWVNLSSSSGSESENNLFSGDRLDMSLVSCGHSGLPI